MSRPGGVRLLGLLAALALAAFPFADYVRIGRQPYRPQAFAVRVTLLADVPGIDASWALAPRLAFVALALVAVAVVIHRRAASWVMSAAAVVTAASAIGTLRLAGRSSMASLDTGAYLVTLAAVLAALAGIASWRARGSVAAEEADRATINSI